MRHFIIQSVKSLSLLMTLCLSASAIADSTLNPSFFYLVNGQVIGERNILVGDPVNWSLTIQNREGKSASGKLKVNPTKFQANGDAIQLTWKKSPNVANFGIYGWGTPVDLSKYKDVASLTIDMRLDSKPDQEVEIGLDCGYPCGAKMPVKDLITQVGKGKWFSLPLPLNCFKGDNFDLSKISGPFTIVTSGKLGLSIANIRVEKLAAGEKGCVDDEGSTEQPNEKNNEQPKADAKK